MKNWWGKILGGTFGFMLGGPLGALLGAVLGHNFDRGLRQMDEGPVAGQGRQERIQTAYFTACFSVMGALCKADGRVSDEEIRMAESVMAQMQLQPDQKRAAISLFNKGKEKDFPLLGVLQQLQGELGNRSNLKRMFIEILVYAALADGTIHAEEKRVLDLVCRELHLSAATYRSIVDAIKAEHSHHAGPNRAHNGSMSESQAYAILNLSARASDQDIKRAYRRLLSQHHPDKLVAKGLPDEMMKVASARTHEIRTAYETLRRSRGF